MFNPYAFTHKKENKKNIYFYFFSTSPCLLELIKLSRVRVIDNSALGKAASTAGKPGKIIHVYNKQEIGRIGDRVLIAIKSNLYTKGFQGTQILVHP
jgi:large subunit ribosomal protein L14